MEVKICNKCGEEKPLSEFWKNKNLKSGYVYSCKECAYSKIKKIREKNIRFVYNYLLNNPCTDCGESNPIVLQFDHVRGTKVANVAFLLRSKSPSAMESIKEEIAKCEVRCANCHAIKTAREGGWFMYELYYVG